MRHLRLIFPLVIGLLFVTLSGLSLSASPAAAAPLAGFTDTPVPTATKAPPRRRRDQRSGWGAEPKGH